MGLILFIPLTLSVTSEKSFRCNFYSVCYGLLWQPVSVWFVLSLCVIFPYKISDCVWRNPVEGARNHFFPWGAIETGLGQKLPDQKNMTDKWERDSHSKELRACGSNSETTERGDWASTQGSEVMGRDQRSPRRGQGNLFISSFYFYSVLANYLEIS